MLEQGVGSCLLVVGQRRKPRTALTGPLTGNRQTAGVLQDFKILLCCCSLWPWVVTAPFLAFPRDEWILCEDDGPLVSLENL